ncbi:MAG TPA: 50S ribosomal protein L11 methyltransferase [Thermoanaerobaculia bacterium]
MPRLRYSRLEVPRKSSGDDADAIIGLLFLHDPLGFESSGKDLVAYFREAASARAASDRLRAAKIRHALTTDIPEGDPLEVYRARSKAFSVGRRLWIDPGDHASPAPPGERVALRIPASRAFGTGSHASTRLALEALEDETLEGRTVLDVGTGSGILALAAAALGARMAVGFDVDADAVFVARENCARHLFGARVRLFAGPPAACSGEFDLIVANLLADELLPESRRLLARAGRRGRVVLSGITREREPGVLTRLRTGRWKLVGRRTDGEWSCLCLSRASI